MHDSNITTITNNLADGYKQLAKGTFQEASEIQNQRRTNAELRDKWFYTANLPLFRIKEGDLEYGLSGRKVFDEIAGEDIDEFTSQILNKGVYALTKRQNKELEELAEDIVWAKAANLGLIRENDEWSYFLINTSDVDADKLNKDQKPFAAKVHGSMDAKYDPKQEHPDYGETMKMLQQRINQTRLWLPTESHISPYVQNGDAVARASRLSNFGIYSNFSADNRNVNGRGGLRGVRLVEAAEGGDARKILPYNDALAEANKLAPPRSPFNPILRGLVNTIYKKQ